MSQTRSQSAVLDACHETVVSLEVGKACFLSCARQRVAILAACLAAITAVVYLPVIRNGFVDWDDGNQIFNNPHLGLAWENLKWMFTNSDYVHRYLPLGWLSYSIDRALFGGGPFSYHLGNVLLHALNAVLVFVLARQLLSLAMGRSDAASARAAGTSASAPGDSRLLATDVAAALGALWWAVNPLRVEVVAWASARIYCAAIAFFLASLLCYLRACRGPKPNRWLLLSVVLYAGSLFTYPLALGAIVVFAVLDIYPLRRFRLPAGQWRSAESRRVVIEKVLLLVPCALVLAITLWTRTGNANLGAIIDPDQPSVLARAMQSFYVWSYYAWKPWAPFHLAPEYATLLEFDPWSAPFVLAAIAVCAVSVFCWWQRKRRPVLFAIWMCHLALLVPVLGMESFRHYHATDRYNYLQGICWSVAVAAVIIACWRAPRWRAAAPIALLGWASFCAVLISGQIAVWKDSFTLQSRIVESLGRNPDRRPDSRALRDLASHETFLGQLQLERNDFAGAEGSFRHASATAPALVQPGLALAQLLIERGRGAEAMDCLQSLIALHPDEPRARVLLAVILGQSGRFAESAKQFEKALEIAPGDASAHHNYAVTLEHLGDTNSAALHYARAGQLRAELSTSP